MEPRRGLLRVALLVAAVAVAAWLILPTGDVGSASPEEVSRKDAKGPGAPPAATLAPGASAPAPAAPSDAGATSAPDAPATASDLVLHVTGEDGTPVGRANLRLMKDYEGQPDPRQPTWTYLWGSTLPRVLPAQTTPFWVEVTGSADGEGRALPLASVVSGPYAPDAGRIDVTLPAERTIEGRLLDVEGRALPGAKVVALLERGERWAWEEHGEVVTGEDGRFRFGRLREGTYRLEVDPVGPNAPPPVDAFPAGARDVLLRCGPGIVADLTFTDVDGNPVPGVSVQVTYGRSRGRGFGVSWVNPVITDAAGRVRFEGLDPERFYNLEAQVPYDRKDLVPIFDSRWKPTSKTYRLRRALRVSGRVVHADGRAFPGADVWVSPEREEGAPLFLDGRAREDGTFVVENAPAGQVRVGASLHRSEADRWVSDPVEAQAGDTDVVLVMRPDPMGTFEVHVLDWPRPSEGEQAATARLTEEVDGKPAGGQSPPAPVDADGRVRFTQVHLLREQTLYVTTPKGDRCVWAHHLKPADGAAEVALVPALSITGRLRVPEGAENVHVGVSGPGLNGVGTIGPEGTFVIGGLPAGTWKVIAAAEFGGRHVVRTVDADAGASVDLVLE